MDQPSLSVVPLTIQAANANGQSTSSVDLQGKTLIGVVFPGTWTAANLTFLGSVDGGTFNSLYDAGAEINVTSAAASRYVVLSPSTFVGLKLLKLRSGTSATPVQQGADRAMLLICRGV